MLGFTSIIIAGYKSEEKHIVEGLEENDECCKCLCVPNTMVRNRIR